LHEALFFVYVLYSISSDKYYVGQTNDIEARFKHHNSNHKGFTNLYKPWELMLVLQKTSRSESMTLEKKLKNLSKTRLSEFVKKYKSIT